MLSSHLSVECTPPRVSLSLLLHHPHLQVSCFVHVVLRLNNFFGRLYRSVVALAQDWGIRWNTHTGILSFGIERSILGGDRSISTWIHDSRAFSLKSTILLRQRDFLFVLIEFLAGQHCILVFALWVIFAFQGKEKTKRQEKSSKTLNMFTASSTPIKVTKKNSHKCDKDSNIFKHSKFIAFWRPFGDLLHPPTSSNIPKIFPSCGQPSRSRSSKAAALS